MKIRNLPEEQTAFNPSFFTQKMVNKLQYAFYPNAGFIIIYKTNLWEFK